MCINWAFHHSPFSKLKTGRKTVASNEKDFGKRVKSAAYQLDFREDSGVVGSEVPGLTCPKHKPPTSKFDGVTMAGLVCLVM